MLTEGQVNDRLLRDGHIDVEQHARLVIKDGFVWDNTEAAFDLTEHGDVKLRDSFVWLKGYAIESAKVERMMRL
jgi:hypothetical protein